MLSRPRFEPLGSNSGVRSLILATDYIESTFHNMRSRTPISYAALCFFALLSANAQTKATIGNEALPDFVQRERDVVAAIRTAALRGDFSLAEETSKARADVRLKAADSVVTGRRIAEVCGGLCNEDRRDLAIKLAKRALPTLAASNERSDADRAERLYWAAWLQAEILDEKAPALELLKAAEKLSPDDDRIVQLGLRLTAALNFGY